jgi:hypothetical protein
MLYRKRSKLPETRTPYYNAKESDVRDLGLKKNKNLGFVGQDTLVFFLKAKILGCDSEQGLEFKVLRF